MGHHARLRENELLFRCQAQLEGNFLCFARARAHLRALMTQKSCAVGMRNAILRNHLNSIKKTLKIIYLDKVSHCKTASHRYFLNILFHHGQAEDWYKCEIDFVFLLRMSLCRKTMPSMQTIYHPLQEKRESQINNQIMLICYLLLYIQKHY